MSTRIIAVLLIKLMVLDICYPTAAFALTGGPSQPEFESFEPVSTDQMVDLFTGDFNYNIPLLTVPGPNGGYPINLAYHAGVTMEQEASWVGLGWNINVGEISRMMRGLPDDFDGDEVTRITEMKPDVTVGLTPSLQATQELIGAPFNMTAGATIYYNSYRGVGMRRTASLSLVSNNIGGGAFEFGNAFEASLESDSQEGLSIPLSASFTGRISASQNRLSTNAAWSSRQGWSGLGFGYSSSVVARPEVETRNGTVRLTNSALICQSTGTAFSSASYLPAPFAKTSGSEFRGGFRYGISNGPLVGALIGLAGSVSTQRIKEEDEEQKLKAYGYLYTHDRTGQPNGIMDLNREKNVPVTRYIHNAPVPNTTFDPYVIKGQGIGGTFRAHRTDAGLFYDPVQTAHTAGYHLEGEYYVASSLHLGLDAGDISTDQYSGPWRSGMDALTSSSTIDLNHRGAGTGSSPLYEPAYFKSTSELTASRSDRWDHIGKEDPIRFDLGQSSNGGFRNAPRARNSYTQGSSAVGDLMTHNRYGERDRRAQVITYRTFGEFRADPAYTQRAKHLFEGAEDPLNTGDGDPIDANGSAHNAKHLAEISVLNPDGTRYVYGLAAYNITQKEVMAAMARDMAQAKGDAFPGRVGTGQGSDAAIIALDLRDNENGADHFYTSTELPAYAHSHLLTAVYSPDYVDLTGNGPSEDDLGYYVKFNYTTGNTGTYQWRMPYQGFSYEKGYYSSDDDDRVSYTYGTKEVYYLHSVETKTHIAYFRLNDTDTHPRLDAQGAASEDNLVLASRAQQRYLQQIDLYSKSSPAKVLRSVVLTYDPNYPLCRGVENGTGGSGKLTLQSVQFKNLDSERGALSPYTFEYGNLSDPDVDPSYAYLATDRWGTFRPEPNDGYHTNSEHPYVDQSTSATDRNERAAAWCLRRITLPSGGTLEVDYESDDYAYVQDKPAALMCEIVDTSEDTNSPDDGSGLPSATEIKKDDRHIWFRMRSATDDPRSYIQGLDRVYFKVWVDLRQRPDQPERALDYVEGYARIDDHGAVGSSGAYGYFTVLPESYGAGAGVDVHPFRKAAWQYMRYRRPDLFQTLVIGNGADPASSVLGAINYFLNPTAEGSPLNFFTGYYGMANIRGHAKNLQLLDGNGREGKPSYVRLNDNWHKRKYGGGHRVSSITVKDNWTDDGSRSYGKKYTYECIGERDDDRNGSIDPDNAESDFHYSSGVAAYEPMIGGEENALHEPVYYNNADLEVTFRDDESYLEKPFNESYYPAPVVGYSRVVVTDMSPDVDAEDVKLAGNGITVHEFYTAKDFPVISRQTSLGNTHYSKWIPIPLVGSEEYNNNGYTQGYSIELNDMHGQLKSVAQYRSTDDLRNPPVRKTTYFYHTDPDDPKRLKNEVNVLLEGDRMEKAYLGQTVDLMVDMDEHATRTDASTRDANFQTLTAGLWPFLFLIFPCREHVESLYRGLVTNKVIEKHGILERVVVEDEGTTAVQHNLVYDAATGTPLLTSITNSFKDPVYTYTHAAHNTYAGMDAAYKNVGARFTGVQLVNGAGTATIPNADDYFFPGDEVEVWSTVCSNGICEVLYVTSVAGNVVHFETASGGIPLPWTCELRIRRSGHRNLLNASCGTIVSLNDPLATPSDLVSLYNTYIFGHTFPDPHYANFTIPGCDPLDPLRVTCQDMYASDEAHTRTGIDIQAGQGETKCQLKIHFDASPGGSMSEVFLHGFNGTTTPYPEIELSDNGAPLVGSVQNDLEVGMGGCFDRCFLPLHADAVTMSDEWTYDYADIGDPSGAGGPLSTHPGSDYRYGRKGIWRPVANYLYQVERKRGQDVRTDIRRDGEYASFTPFDFADLGNNSANWHERDRFLRYSPYGFALETQDAVGDHATDLYGYGNSQVVAGAKNAEYHEVAFDGFEDHAGSTYQSGHGHMVLALPGGSSIQAGGHTGTKALQVNSASARINAKVDAPAPSGWVPKAGQRYTASAWFKDEGSTPRIGISDVTHGTVITPEVVNGQQPTIDGWRKVEVVFQAPASGTDIRLTFELESGDAFRIDDVRVQPSDATMSTFVYDPDLLWLTATLDERNYATFYTYDEEGVLTQIKKETERGIRTIRTTRQNVQTVQ